MFPPADAKITRQQAWELLRQYNGDVFYLQHTLRPIPKLVFTRLGKHHQAAWQNRTISGVA